MAEIIAVSSLDIPQLKIYTSLTDSHLRKLLEYDNGIFIAESDTVIEVALSAGCVPISALTDEKYLNHRAMDILKKCDIPVYTASSKEMKKLTGYKLNRGMLCAMKRLVLPSVEDICRNARGIAVIANIADSTNVGAIIRSAAALGIDAVLVSTSCCDPLCRRAIRVSMGTVFLIPWTYIGDNDKNWYKTGIPTLHKMGFKTVAMALTDNSVGIEDKALKREEQLAIILGTEGYGLCENTIKMSDYTVKIPMYHNVDSLNVAAASAVAFYELCK